MSSPWVLVDVHKWKHINWLLGRKPPMVQVNFQNIDGIGVSGFQAPAESVLPRYVSCEIIKIVKSEYSMIRHFVVDGSDDLWHEISTRRGVTLDSTGLITQGTVRLLCDHGAVVAEIAGIDD